MVDVARRDGLEHHSNVQRTGGTVQHGQAIKQKARGQRPQDEVLHGGLGRDRIVTTHRHQRVAGQCEQLQAQVDHQKVIARDHHEHAQQGEQAEGEEFPATQHVALGCIGAPVDQRHHYRDGCEAFEPVAHRVTDHLVAKTVERLFAGGVQRQQHGHYSQRQQTQDVGCGTAGAFNTQVNQGDDAGHNREDDLRINCDPTDFVNHLSCLLKISRIVLN